MCASSGGGRQAALGPRSDDKDEGEEDEEEADAYPGHAVLVVDGWLSLRLPDASLTPLLCLRRRLAACFAAKARLPCLALCDSDGCMHRTSVSFSWSTPFCGLLPPSCACVSAQTGALHVCFFCLIPLATFPTERWRQLPQHIQWP